MLNYARGHLKEIAARQIRAQSTFTAILRDIAELTDDEAARAFSRMLKARAVKYDGTRYTVTHGSFLDRDAIERFTFKDY